MKTPMDRLISEIQCSLNIYPKFSLGGRCMYCGKRHGIHLYSRRRMRLEQEEAERDIKEYIRKQNL